MTYLSTRVKVAEIEEAEKDKMRKKCKKIIDHGVNVFVNRQLIYNFPEQVGTKMGLARCFAIRPKSTNLRLFIRSIRF